MNINSTSTFCPTCAEGVTVTIRRFSVALRARVELQLAEYREKQKDIARAIAETYINPVVKDDAGNVVESGDTPEVQLEKLKKQAAFRIDFDSLDNAYLKPAYLRVYVEKIEGLTIDGQPATVESFIEKAPPQIGDEIYAYIGSHNGLTPGEKSASGQPGTSEPPEATPTPTTTANTAENPA